MKREKGTLNMTVTMTMIIEFSCAGVCVLLTLIFPKKNRMSWLLAAAFILSYIGDRFLGRRTTETNYIYGILFYFTAHVCFIIYALKAVSKGRLSRTVLAVVTTLYLIFYLAALLKSPQLRGNPVFAAAVLLYVLISCISLAASVDLSGGLSLSWIFTAGILCLLISDTIIALREFTGYRRYSFLIMPLFYTSHILIALFVMMKNALSRSNSRE